MIIPKLVGRLGNQCFQIAAAIAHAKKMHTDWGVPHKTEDMRIWPMYFRNLPFTRHIPIVQYNEPRHCYDALPLQKDMFLNGYFQSEKYFSDARNDVASALGFKFNGGGSFVAIHIRRGDYLQYTDQFPVLPIDYYQEAISHFKKLGWERFVVFTDDQKYFTTYFLKMIDWGNAKVKLDLHTDPISAMQYMYNADGFILANSTFSLFPAILSGIDDYIIAPAEQRWYGPKNSHMETCDLMPEKFIKI